MVKAIHGLKEENIELGSRILAIADILTALSNIDLIEKYVIARGYGQIWLKKTNLTDL